MRTGSARSGRESDALRRHSRANPATWRRLAPAFARCPSTLLPQSVGSHYQSAAPLAHLNLVARLPGQSAPSPCIGGRAGAGRGRRLASRWSTQSKGPGGGRAPRILEWLGGILPNIMQAARRRALASVRGAPPLAGASKRASVAALPGAHARAAPRAAQRLSSTCSSNISRSGRSSVSSSRCTRVPNPGVLFLRQHAPLCTVNAAIIDRRRIRRCDTRTATAPLAPPPAGGNSTAPCGQAYLDPWLDLLPHPLHSTPQSHTRAKMGCGASKPGQHGIFGPTGDRNSRCAPPLRCFHPTRCTAACNAFP